ncbi:telomerase reverse transcriptase isoform X2 [Ziziphus jujuba]|uniref:Telomerase reverse transcriptase n=1 Tax=Ziziphus jujuba TaxID=326968 RepID=A0A6P6GKY2_ZIZJJ|nr:telomerase reverse transcriptase isoform X2 [Ziziphus jujuba]
MPDKRRTPVILRRIFRDRARTLANTIISLLTLPSPSAVTDCSHCEGRRCLFCGGAEEAINFLLRRSDPSGYRKLLNRCFVVISETAPPNPHFQPYNNWSQHQIVATTIELIKCEKPVSTNVISSGYNRLNQSSQIVELLTSSAWCLLLERVGDEIMVYLLKHASIFLPLPRKKHRQVTGPPIDKLCFDMLKRRTESKNQHSQLIPCGSQKKRKRDDNGNPDLVTEQLSSSLTDGETLSSITCVGCCEGRSCLTSCSRLHGDKNCEMSLSEADMQKHKNGIVNTVGNLDKKLKQCSNQTTEKLGKRSRPFSWHRRRKCRQLNFQEITDQVPCTRILTHKDSFPERSEWKANQNDSHEKNTPQCCCLVMQIPRKVNKGAAIDRNSLFYNLEFSSSAFPREHVLNSLKPNSSGSKFLIGSIFGLPDVNISPQSKPWSHNSSVSPCGSACLVRNCCHLRLLDKHCAVPSVDQHAIESSSCLFKGSEFEYKFPKKSEDCFTKCCEESLQPTDAQAEALKSYCSKSQVVSFIWAVCRSIVPSDLLGTPSNSRVLRRNISKFIQLRRFETFSLKQCMHKLKTSRFPILSSKGSLWCLNNQVLEHMEVQSLDTHSRSSRLNDTTHIMKQKLLEGWIYWFFSYLVKPLLQSNFYITDSQDGKQDVYYYKKSVWNKVIDRTITCLKDESYCYLDNAAARNIMSNRSFGFSKLRLFPKENGVRLIANLKVPSKIPKKDFYFKDQSGGKQRGAQLSSKMVEFDYFKSVNSVLRDTHAVLKGIQVEEHGKLGSSVFDYNDVYRKLCPFLIGLRNGSSTMPGVFIVVSDVLKAFDTIDQDKLLSVMKDVISKDEYILKQSYQVLSTKKSFWIRENLVLMDHNISSKFTYSVPFQSSHSILVDQECNKSLKKEALFSTLKEHVKRNVLQLDSKFYLQILGISQGSVLSSLLCSFYYGHLEKNLIFPFLPKTIEPGLQDLSRNNNQDTFVVQNRKEIITSSSCMLLRFIDDYLFISTSKRMAENFYLRLQRGFQAYNCFMNEDKFSTNFNIGWLPTMPSKRVYAGADGISFLQWSGLLINCRSLEVQADYTRYLNNHLKSTLTVSWQDRPGCKLKAKLCHYLRPKCHPIFFDSNINSEGVVRLNIYQSFLLCAMKFHCYFCELSYMCKIHTSSYLNFIENSLSYMEMLIKKRMRSVPLGSNIQPILHLEDGEVEWLGLHAYIQVLKKKQSRHKELLPLLKSKLLAHEISGCVSSQLKYAVDRSHSSAIWKIKY